ncbi:unnamed protein product [Polarella glacialis]|uniref:Calcineurin-like phosphoesterase domain-containing protein n=1 Tax=Polarella glacialis TaxID=89957 RepID=A0A813HNQ5_POLGL|nr:unnamed protein product [Polarella glacialis]
MALAMPPAAEVQDLGHLEGPVLVFGGAYSNLHALEAMLKLAKQDLGIPPSRIIHTGDVVAYCAHPLETTELLMRSGVSCLLGNCEESIGAGSLDCGCGFPEDSACAAFSQNWYAYVMSELKDCPDLKTWMAGLPRRIEFTVAGRRLAVVHGSPSEISRFIWPSSAGAELEANMDVLPPSVEGVICGHSGMPFARLVPGRATSASGGRNRSRLWLNAGVIGMPANDGTQQAWYAVLSPTAGQIRVDLRSLDYDAQGAADAILARPQLVRAYGDSLTTGIWPSHDILPVDEQMASGVPLSEFSLEWPAEPDGADARTDGFSRRLQPSAALAAALVACTVALALAASSHRFFSPARRRFL